MSTVEAELLPPETKQAVAVREQGGAVGRALSASEITQRLQFIKQVMAENMTEGTDYGKIPGCGDKPGLFQPGAQKLSMTFQLNPSVREEMITDYPNYHRGYRMIVRVENGPKFAEGVGECSTLESKYRYRSSNRKCPNCGKETILKSKHAGEGYFCWAKKGGCGAKFDLGDKAIEGQKDGRVEHENPPDFWNTVRKMAFKRAFIHAIINATNTSELWSQDLEDLAGNASASTDRQESRHERDPEEEDQLPFEAATPAKSPQDAPAANTTPVKPKSSPQPKPAPAAGVIEATEEQKTRMIAILDGEPEARLKATLYFIEIGALLPNEALESLPLRFVPRMASQMRELGMRIETLANHGKAEKCVWFFDHVGAAPKASAPAAPPAQAAPSSQKVGILTAHLNAKDERAVQAKPKDPEWWRAVIVPVPRKGMKRDEYLRRPDTIGSLFEMRHGNDEEAQAARQRLFGFVHNYQPTGWEKRSGEKMPPSAADLKFREALDAFNDWFERNHPDEKL